MTTESLTSSTSGPTFRHADRPQYGGHALPQPVTPRRHLGSSRGGLEAFGGQIQAPVSSLEPTVEGWRMGVYTWR